jgi:hypothetical protein
MLEWDVSRACPSHLSTKSQRDATARALERPCEEQSLSVGCYPSFVTSDKQVPGFVYYRSHFTPIYTPLQLHPTAAARTTAVRKCASHAARVAQNRANLYRTNLPPSASAKKSGHEGNCRGSSVYRLLSIFFSSRHLRIRCADSLPLEPPGADERRLP